MSEQEQTAKKSSKKVDWGKRRELSLWFVVAIVAAFWTGTLLGGYQNQAYVNHINDVKTQAVKDATAASKDTE